MYVEALSFSFRFAGRRRKTGTRMGSERVAARQKIQLQLRIRMVEGARRELCVKHRLRRLHNGFLFGWKNR